MDENITQGMPREGDDNQFPSILDQELPNAPVPEKEQAPSETDADIRRRERRATFRVRERELAEKERDLIEREARQKAYEEFSKREAPQDVDPEWLQIYGDTPASRQAWALEERRLARREEKLREELRQEVAREREQELAKERQAEDDVQLAIESIEDKYDVDFSSNSPAARKARTMFLDALDEVSPENADVLGNPEAAYKLYTLMREKEGNNARAKEASSRSMAPSGQSNAPKEQDDAVRAYLRANGIKV